MDMSKKIKLDELCRYIEKWGACLDIKRVVKPRFWIIVMCTMVVLFLCIYTLQGRLILQQQDRIAELELKRVACANANSVLQRKIDFTKTDVYVERVAHDELGLLHDNETRYVFETQPGDTISQVTAQNG